MMQLQDFASQSLEFWVNTLLLDGYGKTLDMLNSTLLVMNFFDPGIPKLSDLLLASAT